MQIASYAGMTICSHIVLLGVVSPNITILRQNTRKPLQYCKLWTTVFKCGSLPNTWQSSVWVPFGELRGWCL